MSRRVSIPPEHLATLCKMAFALDLASMQAEVEDARKGAAIKAFDVPAAAEARRKARYAQNECERQRKDMWDFIEKILPETEEGDWRLKEEEGVVESR